MKYNLAFVLLLTPFSLFATQHCPAIDTITQVGAAYTAKTAEGGEWIGLLQGTLPAQSAIKDFSEALLILDSDRDKGNLIDQGNFQKCTYNLETEGKQIDMYYDNKTWLVSISGKPHWKYQQSPLLEIYLCSDVAAEECKFDILPQESTS
ncbi:DUF3757 domain-containing protein [Yersinia bercovieri]|uniref:DUF3757 domain-containing protein n=1 Tax=Yersinia bercovieri TaxID=634 RepID=UPI001643871C|nr:DUF3757 domain-containing protein [Yersinia bercovieri]MCB5301886.1 DUF3757 domain-containing protein [Yersinia bercovieri]